MGYRVSYQPVRKVRGTEKRVSRVPAMTALFLILFLLLLNSLWPFGAEILRDILIPGDADATVMALETFAYELQAGEGLTSAFENFCRKIMDEAQLDPY